MRITGVIVSPRRLFFRLSGQKHPQMVRANVGQLSFSGKWTRRSSRPPAMDGIDSCQHFEKRKRANTLCWRDGATSPLAHHRSCKKSTVEVSIRVAAAGADCAASVSVYLFI